MFLSTWGPLLSPGLVKRAVLPPDDKRGVLYGPAKSLQQWNHPLNPAPVHDKRKLLPSIAEGQAVGGSFKAGCDEPQDLIPYLMPVTIVEMLEKIHVHHRDGIVPPQPPKALLKGPTAGYARKLI
jgi:hypothetical protein